MNINLAELLSIIIAVFSVFAAIWRIAAIEKTFKYLFGKLIVK